MTATEIHMARIRLWWAGTPLARTRRPQLAALERGGLNSPCVNKLLSTSQGQPGPSWVCFPKPAECLFPLQASKVPHVRLNKVTGELGCDGEKATVTHHSHFLDTPMMVFDEAQVRDQGCEV